MIHFLNPDHLDSLQKFSLLFDEAHLQKIDMGTDFDKLHLYISRYLGGRGGGIAKDEISAKFRAMGEALERYSISQARPDYVNISYIKLIQKGIPCLDPNSYKCFSDDLNTVKNGEAYNLNRKADVDWTWFESALGEEILLPNQINQYLNRRPPIYFASSSSGLSCGKSKISAKLGALLEFIERDAFSFYWCTKNIPKQINIKSTNPDLERLLIPFKSILPNTYLFYLETDISCTVNVLAVFKGSKNCAPYFAVAGASRLNPLDAISKALQELAHNIHYLRTTARGKPEKYSLDFEKGLWDFSDHSSLYATVSMTEVYKFLFSRRSELISIQDIPHIGVVNDESALQIVVNDFLKNNHRLYFKNNTPAYVAEAGLFIYRAFSPDLISIWPMHRYRKYGFERYYKLAQKLALKVRPKSTKNFNSFPHPYP